MSLFGFGKKREEKGNLEVGEKKSDAIQGEEMKVKILGSGCARCNQLESETLKALQELGMDEEIDHVTDFAKIASYGVMSTPALVVDGKVLSAGRVLKEDEIVRLLKKARG
jgi:small redox-active disulfide protein 2